MSVKTSISAKLTRWCLVALVFASFLAPVVVVQTTSAGPAPQCKLGQTPAKDKCSGTPCDPNSTDPATACACDPAIKNCATGSTACVGNDCGLLEKYVNPAINFLAAAVGLIVTIVIVIGGIQYSASADDPQRVAQAKQRIINAVLALLAFMFIWAFLQWLTPGGVF